MDFKCKCGEKISIHKSTTVYRDGEWVVKEALCKCGEYMKQILTEEYIGIPTLQRTEPSLTKRRDKLWAGAKEKLIGERGINEPIN